MIVFIYFLRSKSFRPRGRRACCGVRRCPPWSPPCCGRRARWWSAAARTPRTRSGADLDSVLLSVRHEEDKVDTASRVSHFVSILNACLTGLLLVRSSLPSLLLSGQLSQKMPPCAQWFTVNTALPSKPGLTGPSQYLWFTEDPPKGARASWLLKICKFTSIVGKEYKNVENVQ